jgi:hypothetical protein
MTPGTLSAFEGIRPASPAREGELLARLALRARGNASVRLGFR